VVVVVVIGYPRSVFSYILKGTKGVMKWIFPDLADSPFGAGGSVRGGRRQRRGEDVVHPLKVSLEDLYNGTSKKLSLSRNVICTKCKG